MKSILISVSFYANVPTSKEWNLTHVLRTLIAFTVCGHGLALREARMISRTESNSSTISPATTSVSSRCRGASTNISRKMANVCLIAQR